MVKKISLILILLLIAFPAAFAAVDVDLVGGIGGSVISMGFGTLGGNTGGDFQMAFDVSAETDVLFNANHGLYAGLGLSATAARNGSASLMIFTGYMFLDGKVEEDFAKEMDIPDNEVYIYAKLPRGFQIPTPMGNYAPDWAIVFHQDKVKHIFFVAETKGTLDSEELRGIEDGKISCAKKLFSSIRTRDIHYEHVSTYQDLMNKVMSR